MAINEEILDLLLEQHFFEDRDRMVAGIARLAVDEGVDSLTPKQRYHIGPYLSQKCDGYTDPGGQHHDCPSILITEKLKDALIERPQYDSLMCESCRAQVDYFAYRRDRLDRE